MDVFSLHRYVWYIDSMALPPGSQAFWNLHLFYLFHVHYQRWFQVVPPSHNIYNSLSRRSTYFHQYAIFSQRFEKAPANKCLRGFNDKLKQFKSHNTRLLFMSASNLLNSRLSKATGIDQPRGQRQLKIRWIFAIPARRHRQIMLK